MRLPDLLYGLAFLAGLPLWFPRLLKREQRRHLLRRFAPATTPIAAGCIWIHAVSVGEVRGISDLIARVRDTFALPVVLTVTTLSGYNWARKSLADVAVIPAPIDFTWVIRRYLRCLAPRLLLLNELEVWPNWTRLAQQRGIPIVVANARMSAGAFRRYRRFRGLVRASFSRPHAWLAQSSAYMQRFVELGVAPDRIRVCGNIKADQALAAVEHLPSRDEILAHLRAREPRKPLVVLSSTHDEDEARLLPALAAMPIAPAVILVPRHPGRVAAICRRLEKLDLPFAVWSHASAVDLDRGILVYDRIGYLLPLMSIADQVFMGGTFSPHTGGHNLYEPAALGRPIWGGPEFSNFPEISRALLNAGAYRMVTDDAGVAGALALAADPATGARARAVVEAMRGTTARILAEIEKWLDS
ncbi:MAG: glycosyltransferase N-terminal domain-containing protein [Acidobacteriota bacterium]|jgi:3-deoxy-D-manno-octulosonic-acid transferase|nr:glycosyltransferase N-terminal domain-containing protein [Acidobacteriota bacterium]